MPNNGMLGDNSIVVGDTIGVMMGDNNGMMGGNN